MRHTNLLGTTLILACLLAGACRQKDSKQTNMTEKESTTAPTVYKTTGTIERLDAALDNIIAPDAKIEILATGFDWSEGPLWLPEQNKLLFSDIPPNKIYEWSEEGGLKLYLTPSGYTSEVPRGGEVGSNALILDKQGRLVLCQHGDRRMARMDAPLNQPKPNYITLADKFEGKRLNSPNDAVYKSNGDLYFTDPPYGLEKNADDPAKEIPFQGVYRLTADGAIHLLTKELSRPNGLAFSPDEKTFYVANSDPDKAIWMAYDVQPDGNITNGRLFYDATSQAKTEKGLPDGLKINRQGYLFATGPGGVLIFDKNAKHLGTIRTGEATSNCAFNADESVLYLTADDYIMRVKLK
ncbi:SMP-30/gluconolactonase/LRE family protein [Adhaeribacter rhizoryzae]|uniref:SMP-30/gluconolactonase/LRE family protein n=1 Tax=Adhaeribacter rhizoryzae TaxID=2607907 RepID=A0A5M6D416_9BACT|nr:SMP-30/gluconolactonase/LRE family protein [Adhaeribacter rhizoryzae]KAA5541606.1 SMP-30/gluconolactonase/LRE family protein [Adhaeribacter rhizoryzae]